MHYQTVIRWSHPREDVDMFSRSTIHAVANYGRFPTLCGYTPRSMTDHPMRPTYRWEWSDWREGVTCKHCLKALEDLE